MRLHNIDIYHRKAGTPGHEHPHKNAGKDKPLKGK